MSYLDEIKMAWGGVCWPGENIWLQSMIIIGRVGRPLTGMKRICHVYKSNTNWTSDSPIRPSRLPRSIWSYGSRCLVNSKAEHKTPCHAI